MKILAKDREFWGQTKKSYIGLFASRLSNQFHFSQTSCAIIVGIHILQTIFLFTEASTYTLFPNNYQLKLLLGNTTTFVLARYSIEIRNSEVLQILFLIILAMYLVLILSLTIIFWTRLLQNDKILSVSRYWKILSQIHLYVLFLPLHNIMSEIAIQAYSFQLSEAGWIFILVFVGESINVALCLLSFLTDLNIQSFDYLATSAEYFSIFMWLERTFISEINLLIFYYKVTDLPSLAINLINLGLTVFHLFILFHTSPFYSRVILLLRVFESGMMLCFTLTSLVFYGYDLSNSTYKLLYLVLISTALSLLFLKFAVNSIQLRITNTLRLAFDHISNDAKHKALNVYWLIQSVHQLKSILGLDLYRPITHSHYIESILKQYGYSQHLNMIFTHSQFDFEGIYNPENKNKTFVITLIDRIRKKHPSNHSLSLILIELMVKDLNLIYEPFIIIQEILQKDNLQRNIRLSLLYMKETIQRAIRNNQSEDYFRLNLRDFFEMFKIWYGLKSRIDSQIIEKNKFFQSLRDEKVDLHAITECGLKAQALYEEVIQFWNSYPSSVLEYNTSLFFIYGIYQMKVNFEHLEGAQLFQKVGNLVKQRTYINQGSEIIRETLTLDNNSTFIIDTTKKSLGNIIYCTTYTNTMFGERSEELIGQNLNVIMSPFFQKVHNAQILKKLESTEKILNTSHFQTFGQHKTGFIFPVNILTTLFPITEKGLFFAGIVREIQSNLAYLLFDDEGYIDSYSKSLQSILNLPMPTENKKIKVLELCAKSDNKIANSLAFYLENFFLQPSPDQIRKTESGHFSGLTKRRGINEDSRQKPSSSEGISGFCTWNADLEIFKLKSSEEKIILMKWKVDKKLYSNRIMGILSLEEAQSNRGYMSNQYKLNQERPVLIAHKPISGYPAQMPETESDFTRSVENVSKLVEKEEKDDNVEYNEPSKREALGDEIIVPDFSQVFSKRNPNMKVTSEKLERLRLDFKKVQPSLRSSGPRENSARLLLSPHQDTILSSEFQKTDDQLTETIPLKILIKKDNKEYELKTFKTNFKKITSSLEKKEGQLSALSLKESVAPDLEIKLKSNQDKVQSKKKSSSKSIHPSLIEELDTKNNIKTLKFSKFSQAKIPLILLIISLIILFASSVFVFSIAVSTFPVIQVVFLALRNSHDRIINLSLLEWQTVGLNYYTKIFYCESCLNAKQELMMTAISEFTSKNLQIQQNIGYFSSNFSDFVFSRNIKLYMDDFSNKISRNNFAFYNSFEAAYLVIDHALLLAKAKEFKSLSFQLDLDFILTNMLNDFLIKFQEESRLIMQEIIKIFTNVESSLTIFLIVIICFFGITIAILIMVYIKAYLDAQRFLKLFTYFNDKNLENIINQLNNFRHAMDSNFEDQDLLKEAQVTAKLSDNSFIKPHKSYKSRKFALQVLKRALILLLLLLVPIILALVSKDVFTSGFDNTKSTLFNIIKPKQIVVQATLCLAQTQLYSSRKDILVFNKDSSLALNQAIESLADLVSEDIGAVTSEGETYQLLHLDYCQFVNPQNYTACKALFNGVSSSGIVGMVLTLQTLLMNYKAITDSGTNYTGTWTKSFQDSFSMISLADAAVKYVQAQSVLSLDEDLAKIKKTMIIFIIISLAACLVLSILGDICVFSFKESQRKSMQTPFGFS